MLNTIEAANLAGLTGVRHGFFTREGGVSEGLYASLNCGLGSSDDAALVLENRRRAGRQLHDRSEGVITLYQEHGTTALRVTAPPSRNALPRADAVISTTPGLVIGVLTADCAPVLFADSEAGVVAAAHAGWRGALDGVIESAVAEMERHGARRPHIHAAVGPCINQNAYEVGPEFEKAFLDREAGYARYFSRTSEGGRPHFNLPGFVYDRLIAARLGTVTSVAACTCENESQFFSYRRKTHRQEPDYGRQISAIVVA